MDGQSHSLRILLIENEAQGNLTIGDCINAMTGLPVELDRVTTYEAGFDALVCNAYSLCLLDYHLDQHNGLELLCSAYNAGCTTPIIIMTINEDDLVDRKALQMGAADYLAKKQVSPALLKRILLHASDRAKRSAALHEGSDLLHFVTGVTGDVYYRLRYETMEYEYLSPSIIQLTGYSPEEIALVGFRNLIKRVETPDSLYQGEVVMGALTDTLDIEQDQIRKELEEYQVDYLLKTKEGLLRWVNDRSYPWRNNEGQVIGAIGILTDITKRKRVEEALQSSETTYRYLFAHNPRSMIVYDLDSLHLLEVNDATLMQYGYTRREFLQKRMSDIRPSNDALRYFETMEQVQPGAHFYNELQHRRKDGQIIDVSVVQKTVDFDGRRAALAVIEDITERKQAQEKIMLQASLLDQVQNAVIATDLDGRIIYWNSFAETLFQWTRSDVLGRNINDVINPHYSQDLEEDIQTQILQLGGWRGEMVIERKDGNQLVIDATTSIVQDDEGVVIGMVSISVDATARLQAEQLERDRRRVLEMVTENQPLKAIMEQVVALVERQRPDLICSILLVQDDRLHHIAPSKLPDAYTRLIDGISAYSEDNPLSVAVMQNETYIYDDIANDPLWIRYHDLTAVHHLVACWLVPVISGNGQVLSLFALYYQEKRVPERADHDLLAMASKLATVAIEQSQLTALLAYQAHHDPLVGLPNRFLFGKRLQEAITRAQKTGCMAALLYLDLDHFKEVNDTLGHVMGDNLLRKVVGRFESQIGKDDTLARMGGDEFMIVMNDLDDVAKAEQLAQRLLDVMREPFTVDNYDLFVGVSIGISVYPRDGKDAITLQRNADMAMYRAKHQGRNRYQCFTPEMNEIARDRLELGNQLRKAVEHGELLLRYQPQYDLLSGSINGIEALVVWKHPVYGILMPSRFIPLAEETGLIISIGNWILSEACHQFTEWRNKGYAIGKIAVNISSVQLSQADFVDSVMDILAKYRMDPSLLEIEVTESMVISDYQFITSQLARLRELGVAIAVDDFGTGYSSLGYLQRLPIDTLKIDKTFVSDLNAGSQAAVTSEAIIRAVTTLARNLEMRIIAEGIETVEQLKIVQRLGCNTIQGYLFSKPVSPQDCENLFKKKQEIHFEN